MSFNASSSAGSSEPSWTCETRIGITLVAEAATLSCISVLSLLIYIGYQKYHHRRQPEARLIRSHLDLYLIGLFSSDFVQAVGGMMDIKWVARSGVLEGRYCVVQGFLEQIGDVGVALCTLAISTHTFAEIILRWQEPKSFTLPKVALSLFVLFLFLISTIGYVIHRNSDYYGNTVYWCWITKKYLAEGIGLEYAWLWLTAAVNFLLYFVVFLVLKQYLIVEKTVTGRFHIYVTSRKARAELRRYPQFVPPHRVLYFPAAYIITVIPVAIVRIHAFVTSANDVPFPATVLGGMFFSAGGFFNVMVYTFTRPGLLRPMRRRSLPPVVERPNPRVFDIHNRIEYPSRPDQVALVMKSHAII